ALPAPDWASGHVPVLLTGMIAGRGGPRGAGRAAIWLAALWPHQLHYVRYILSEVPATALLVGSAWLFCASRWFPAGLAVGGVMLVRTVLAPVFALAAIVLALRPPRHALAR